MATFPESEELHGRARALLGVPKLVLPEFLRRSLPVNAYATVAQYFVFLLI